MLKDEKKSVQNVEKVCKMMRKCANLRESFEKVY